MDALLPTPMSNDAKGTRNETAGRTNPDSKHHSGTTLTDAIALLPTPRVRHGDNNPSGFRRHSPGIEAVAFHFPDLLPTPNASDSTGGGMHPDRRVGHSHQLIDYALIYDTPNWNKYEPAIRRWESLTRPAPYPAEPNSKGNLRLNAAFSEWMMGWPKGWVTEVDGITRNQQLKIIGNGVVPQQAAAAIRSLL